MPEISVIMPVYNVEKYLRECLDSLLAQTFTDFEAICVNDGSTDGSPAILEEYAAKDSRIKIIDQPNSGAAKSRNNGMSIACGKYWMFLDSDDWFMPDMLSAMHKRAVATNAEITICAYEAFDSSSGKTSYRITYDDKFLSRNTFSLKQDADIFIHEFQPAPWINLYRADYISKLGLCFQDLPRSNDLYFTRCALLHADKIVVVNEILVRYRIGMTTNLQSGNSKSPLAFLQAMYAVADYLKSHDLWEIYQSRFNIDLLRLCEYNLATQKTAEGFITLFEEIQNNVLPKFLQNSDTAQFPPECSAFYQRICSSAVPVEYLMLTQKEAKIKREELFAEIEKQTALYNEIKNSGAYKLGRLLLAPINCIRKIFQ